MRRALFTAVSALAFAPLTANALMLRLPIACEVGRDCFIMKLVDHDDGPGVKDYRCGSLTDDGHKGTDIRITTIEAMNKEPGVDVLAAAKGTVIGVRDKLRDISVKKYDPKVIAGYECGNGVRIEHAEGYATQYCHLKKDSITVKVGDTVKTGQPIGKVGLSGSTELPHLHFQVSQGEKIVDPFTGRAMDTPCGESGVTMWKESALKALTYQPTTVVLTGISAEEPEVDGILEGKYRDEALPTDATTLYYWVYGHGLQPEQDIRMELLGPHGKKLVKTPVKIDKYQLWFLRFIGKRSTEGFEPGDYTGRFSATKIVDGVPQKQAESEWKAKVAE